MKRGEYQAGIALTDRYAQLQERAREMATELRYYKAKCEMLGRQLEKAGMELEKLKAWKEKEDDV